VSTAADNVETEGRTDLGLITARLWKWRRWIIGSVGFSAAAFAGVAFLMTPTYRAAVLLAPASTARGTGAVAFGTSPLSALMAGTGIGIGPRDVETEEALAVLRSRQLTERFIADRNLMPKLFSSKWDVAKGNWRVDEQHQPTPAKAFKYFDEKIRSVVRDKRTGLVTLQIDWTDRYEAAGWANELVRLLNQEMRTRAVEQSEASMRFLEKELQTASTVEERDAIGRLLETQVKQRMIANVTEDYSFRVVDKAMPADADDPIRPKKLLLLAVGPFVGLVLSVFGIFVSDRLFPQRAERQLGAGGQRADALQVPPTTPGN
jgi:uncharacterized protein involved in exopolysaccharide biosynthesis